ncbi:GIY-YIG nuclease family protein [Sphingobium sp. CR2-8]|uniref:GIY-YIG nuclease family protein n=1 Tax=Sphingobium sp. CR2-8 TaxID=1306534 RepID=UPI002DB9C3F7|nr:GIY-YIG nuclease family protein [Sphingobium sp. CR2-8]MEC3911224.1 GIY-YIG nuclease family protein [Sphingobium sp. CR2-8]
MTFWTYMLHCADRSFYVGHTDNLEVRIGQHEVGQITGYTQSRQPIKLVWSQAFGTRMEALEAERQIKGWNRAKKLALIREDWSLISTLARSNQESKALRQAQRERSYFWKTTSIPSAAASSPSSAPPMRASPRWSTRS